MMLLSAVGLHPQLRCLSLPRWFLRSSTNHSADCGRLRTAVVQPCRRGKRPVGFSIRVVLILLFLMVLLALLQSRTSDRPQTWRFILATIVRGRCFVFFRPRPALVANRSHCSHLGPTGWPRHWNARARNELVTWVLVAVVTTGSTSLGYVGRSSSTIRFTSFNPFSAMLEMCSRAELRSLVCTRCLAQYCLSHPEWSLSVVFRREPREILYRSA